MFYPPKDYKVNGVVYEIDINNGFAKDGENLTEKLKGILKNDIVSTSIVSYNIKCYPVTCIGCSAFFRL